MLVAAFVYLATGLLLRIHRRPGSWWSFVLLGLTLGLAYLTKVFMFPGPSRFPPGGDTRGPGVGKGALVLVAVADSGRLFGDVPSIHCSLHHLCNATG